MDNQLIKPITVVREEFISNLTNLINDSMLPAFIIEPILKDMYLETKAMAQRQYEMDRNIYEQSLIEAESKSEEDVA